MDILTLDTKYFLKIAEAGSLSKAAEELEVRQSSLSKAIQRVEKTLGRPVFIRHRQGVKLTEAGLRFQKQLHKIEEDWGAGLSQILAEEREVSGNFRLGCHPSIGVSALPHFLPGLMIRFPRLRFRIAHQSSRETTEAVIAMKLDFGLVMDPVLHPDLVISPIRKEGVHLWVSSRPTSLQSFESGRAAIFFHPEMIHVNQVLEKLKKQGKQVHQTIPIDDYEVIVELVGGGAGIGILPDHIAQRGRREPLEVIESQLISSQHRLCLIYRADAQKTLASKEIIDSIKKMRSDAVKASLRHR